MKRYIPVQMGLAACVLLLGCLRAAGQVEGQTTGVKQEPGKDDDPAAILEIGAAMNWNLSGGAATFAPNLAAEITPIENWLEIEAGVSPFYTHKSTEWDTDLLFKKPWTLSRKAEFMAGIGPEWIHLSQNGKSSNSIAAELAGDFMFWPSGKHRFGWYLEPAYDYSFAGGHQQSVGMSAGLLIGIR
ncbi:hypothetical protein [Terracidiphilus sp.]|jgi:hypothetical protein|uniref:hypothetical protein n=1 Tax=Terracidiphilus sp. TaxID=1964191 RepID=UPI003C224237